MTYRFDHLVISAETLEEGVAAMEARLGVPFETGGKHARYGTHNALLGLQGGLYLEVIAIDPGAEPEARPRWFGLDAFAGAPRLTNWVCEARGLDLPQGFRRVVALTRGDLSWRMAEADKGLLPFDQCFPGLIDWGETPHPATRLTPAPLRLKRFEISHPEAVALRAQLGQIAGADVVITRGAAGLKACFERADGMEIWL